MNKKQGKITQVISAVVDVRFDDGVQKKNGFERN